MWILTLLLTALLSSLLTLAVCFIFYHINVKPALLKFKAQEEARLSALIEERVAQGVRNGVRQSLRDLAGVDSVKGGTRSLMRFGTELVEGGISSLLKEQNQVAEKGTKK